MGIDITTKLTVLAEKILRSLRMELVDLEYRREGRNMVLRLFIDRDGGVTLDDCALVSRELSEELDVEDLIPDKYTLEVSSPGLNRPLKAEADYQRYIGRTIKVRTKELTSDEKGNKRRTFLGELLSFSSGTISVRLREGQLAEIPLEKVEKANLEFEF